MSDAKPTDPDALEFDELEPLEGHPEIEELPELDELDELEPLEPQVAARSASIEPEPPAPAPIEPAKVAPAAAAAPGEFQLRELDKAPAHLRTAALIATAGSLFPWMGHGGGLLTNAAAKALIFAGIGLLYLYWKHRGGERVPGIVAKLSDLSLLPAKKDDEEKKPRRKRATETADASAFLRGAKFPAAIHPLAFAFVIAAVVLPTQEPGTDLGMAAAELGMLAWGLAAWVHIYAYERWNKFSPIFPLMFLGHALAGILGAVKGFGEDGTPWMIAGGALVGAGGCFAAWTIIEALLQAKSEGDAKKVAAAEARRAARKSRSGS